MGQPTEADRLAFLSFVADAHLDESVELPKFLAGGWVRQHMVWKRREDVPEKRNPNMKYPPGHPYAE